MLKVESYFPLKKRRESAVFQPLNILPSGDHMTKICFRIIVKACLCRFVNIRGVLTSHYLVIISYVGKVYAVKWTRKKKDRVKNARTCIVPINVITYFRMRLSLNCIAQHFQIPASWIQRPITFSKLHFNELSFKLHYHDQKNEAGIVNYLLWCFSLKCGLHCLYSIYSIYICIVCIYSQMQMWFRPIGLQCMWQ